MGQDWKCYHRMLCESDFFIYFFFFLEEGGGGVQLKYKTK